MNRRSFIAGSAALLAPAVIVRRAQAAGVDLRIGAVLPLGGSALPIAAANLADVAEIARTGLVHSEEDQQRNAELLGSRVSVFYANAPDAASAGRAAQRLVERDRVTVLIGGFTTDQATTLSQVAQDTGTLFLNIAAPSDTLRGSGCRRHTFHVEASAAMYLDALAGWFVRAQHRKCFVVQEGSAEGEALFARARAVFEDRHWGARIAGRTVIDPGQRDFDPAIRAIAAAEPDMILVLNDWLAQLDFLGRYNAAELEAPVTGFPHAAAQTRHFYTLSRHSAPRAGAGHRAAVWEATLDAYGARELNARFGERWGRPMDPVAWAAYQAVKIAFESALGAGGTDGDRLAAHLVSERAIFDIHKGIGVSFRPWDHQLRQSLYLVRVNPDPAPGDGLQQVKSRAALVGELPAIYMPGTDPVERLDQLGDIDPRRQCGT